MLSQYKSQQYKSLLKNRNSQTNYKEFTKIKRTEDSQNHLEKKSKKITGLNLPDAKMCYIATISCHNGIYVRISK